MNEIICGNFNLIEIPEDSVDLVFTDPPYVKDGIPLYESVAKLGARVLKPMGFLVVYASDYWLDKTFPPMLKWLNYWYLYHYISATQTAAIFPRKLWARGKSLIVFSKHKGNLDNVKWHENLYKNVIKEKSHRIDNWEQTINAAKFFIENLCPVNGTVLDPMCGSGTTCVAAKELGRNYLGIDISEEQCIMARSRL